jgi:hypothetical protein
MPQEIYVLIFGYIIGFYMAMRLGFSAGHGVPFFTQM